MRFIHKLTLLVIAVITAMAVVAPTASATDTVQVVNEKIGAECASTGPYACTVHAVGVMTLRIDLGVFGEAHEATCNLETVMSMGGTGSGTITAFSTSAGAGQEVGCPTVTTECSMPWWISGEEDGPTGVVQSSASVCIDPAESGSNCVGNLAFSLVEQTGEHYETQFNNAAVGLCELDVDLEIESSAAGNAQIHVNHDGGGSSGPLRAVITPLNFFYASPPVTDYIQFKNYGTSPVTTSSVTESSPWITLNSSCTNVTIAPGGSCFLGVTKTGSGAESYILVNYSNFNLASASVIN